MGSVEVLEDWLEVDLKNEVLGQQLVFRASMRSYPLSLRFGPNENGDRKDFLEVTKRLMRAAAMMGDEGWALQYAWSASKAPSSSTHNSTKDKLVSSSSDALDAVAHYELMLHNHSMSTIMRLETYSEERDKVIDQYFEQTSEHFGRAERKSRSAIVLALDACSDMITFAEHFDQLKQDNSYRTKENYPYQLDKTISQSVLWKNEIPAEIADAWASLREYLKGNGLSAIADWYQGYLDGERLDKDLEKSISLLKDDTWGSSIEAVSSAIEEILLRAQLVEKTERLLKALQVEDASIRGHNNPPELIENADLSEKVEAVLVSLKSLNQEARSKTPQKEIVTKAIEVISRWLGEVAKYVGSKIDLSLDTAIKWAIPAGGVYLISQPGKLKEILQIAEAWLRLLQ